MNYQDRTKKASVMKRGERKFPTPTEVKITPQINCHHCNKPSGYENEDFLNIKPPRNIKCKNCGKVCIEIRNSFETE